MEYSDWVNKHEESLREAYIDYLNNSKVHDVHDYYFFWDRVTPEKVLEWSRQAQDAFEEWCAAEYEDWSAYEPDPEDMGADR